MATDHCTSCGRVLTVDDPQSLGVCTLCHDRIVRETNRPALVLCPRCGRREGWDGHPYAPCAPLYSVTYRLTAEPAPKRGATIRRGGPVRLDDGTWRVLVSLTHGRTSWADVPRIVAIAHPIGIVDPETVEITALTLIR